MTEGAPAAWAARATKVRWQKLKSASKQTRQLRVALAIFASSPTEAFCAAKCFMNPLV